MSLSDLGKRPRFFIAALFALAAPAIVGCSGPTAGAPAVAGPALAAPSAGARPNRAEFAYTTLDKAGTTDNVLTGINNLAKLSGYDGRGTASEPSHGYVVYKPYEQSNFRSENYPGAADTWVSALSNNKIIAGYYLSTKGGIFGLIESHGFWTSYRDPQLRKTGTNVTELLGLSDAELAVGFYQDGSGNDHAFELDGPTGKFHNINPPGAVSSVASGINGKGDICGYLTTSSGLTEGFLFKANQFTILAYPGASSTQALGLEWQDQIVGSYTDASGNTHGFTLIGALGSQQWESYDEPNAAGATVFTGVNNHHFVVGYYVDSKGHTNGFLAKPNSSR